MLVFIPGPTRLKPGGSLQLKVKSFLIFVFFFFPHSFSWIKQGMIDCNLGISGIIKLMLPKLKISQHHHSGRLRPHEHTSYIPLFLLLLIVGALLLRFSVNSYVAADSPGPQAGSVGLTGTVPTKPPQSAATITVPKDQQHFIISPIKVTGTCPAATLVELYKNNIFAGSVSCDASGNYALDIDLLYGKNTLTAQVYDVLNQAGPVSTPITVFYDAVAPVAASLSLLNFGGTQLLLNTDAVYRGSFPGQPLNVPISVIGGIAPFAINVQWGDSSNSVIPRSDNTVFNATHTYAKAGTYKIIFQATDAAQQTAFLTVAAVVNGQPAVIGAAGNSSSKQSLLNKLLVLWPLFAISVTLVVSFWLGEKREKSILSKVIGAQQNPALGTTIHTSV